MITTCGYPPFNRLEAFLHASCRPRCLCRNRPRHAQQPSAGRVVVAGRPDHAERQDLSRELPIHNAPELRADGGLARQGQAPPKGNKRQEVVTTDLLELDV